MYREGSRTAGVRLARDLGLPARRAVPLDGMRDAYEQVAYRTTITAIMMPG